MALIPDSKLRDSGFTGEISMPPSIYMWEKFLLFNFIIGLNGENVEKNFKNFPPVIMPVGGE